MYFSSITHFLNTSFSSFENQIVKPLSAQQKKVAMVAIAVFSLLSSAVLIYQYCFRGKKQELDDEDASLGESPKLVNLNKKIGLSQKVLN